MRCVDGNTQHRPVSSHTPGRLVDLLLRPLVAVSCRLHCRSHGAKLEAYIGAFAAVRSASAAISPRACCLRDAPLSVSRVKSRLQRQTAKNSKGSAIVQRTYARRKFCVVGRRTRSYGPTVSTIQSRFPVLLPCLCLPHLGCTSVFISVAFFFQWHNTPHPASSWHERDACLRPSAGHPGIMFTLLCATMCRGLSIC